MPVSKLPGRNEVRDFLTNLTLLGLFILKSIQSFTLIQSFLQIKDDSHHSILDPVRLQFFRLVTTL